MMRLCVATTTAAAAAAATIYVNDNLSRNANDIYECMPFDAKRVARFAMRVFWVCYVPVGCGPEHYCG